MMKTAFLLITLVALPSSFASADSILQQAHQQSDSTKEKIIPAETLAIPGFPIEITSSRLVNLDDFRYTVRNLVSEKITRIEGKLLLLSPAGELKVDADWVIVDLAPNSIKDRQYHYLFLSQSQHKAIEKMNSQDQLIIAVREVIVKSGVWVVKDSEIEEAARAKATGQAVAFPTEEYEANIVLSPNDRFELFQLAVERLLQDQDMLLDSCVLGGVC
ncbi:MAG: hypothetical protein L0229_09685 [Blastocatellia bacterium]|nr:hypothetical protein [Blastocatellia bacterium]